MSYLSEYLDGAMDGDVSAGIDPLCPRAITADLARRHERPVLDQSHVWAPPSSAEDLS